MKKNITVLLLAAILLASCGTSIGETSSDTTANTDTTAEHTEEEYTVPDVDYGGHSFRILNVEDNFWSCYNVMDVESMTGDILNDAVFNRNAKLESELNVELEIVIPGDIYKLNETLQKSVVSGEDTYDVAYIKPDEASGILSEKMLYNLHSVDSLQLDQTWWDPIVIDGLTVNGKLFYASSTAQLMPISLASTLYVNKALLEKNGLEAPYDLVREGKWTYEAMYQLMEQVMTLGTQDTWTWKENGDAIYGVGTHNGLYRNMFYGAGEKLVTLDSNGLPVYNAPTERFYQAAELMAKFMNVTDGHCLNKHDGADWISAFQQDRDLFHFHELQMTMKFREMKSDYGVLPPPKLDGKQESYYAMTSQQAIMMTIPVTNPDPERAGTVMDYMSYLSAGELWESFIDTTVTAKGLRDEDSVEMMGIIRDSIGVDIGLVYNWTGDMMNEMISHIKLGDASIASVAASYSDKINSAIKVSLSDWAD